MNMMMNTMMMMMMMILVVSCVALVCVIYDAWCILCLGVRFLGYFGRTTAARRGAGPGRLRGVDETGRTPRAASSTVSWGTVLLGRVWVECC
jgi:hypothetical protein